ncbi:MAG: FlgD immunoglobulin-like domain containing protein [Bacteroidota bacterium]|nr:FlgD immunoglobulin-like domain containing protein [Bacteroidota bacterium]
MKQLNFFVFVTLLVQGTVFGQTPGQSKNYFYEKIVNINLTQPWTATGVNCKVGDTVYVWVRGVFSSTTNDPGAWVGPDGNGWSGDNQFPVPTASSMSVIGKIGSSGTGFPIGSGRIIPVTVAGELNLGVNDIVNFADNGGALVATILKQQNSVINTRVTGRNVIPLELNLDQNYPNPFNPSTTIEYEIPTRSAVEILIYNSVGQIVRKLQSEQQESGRHSIMWDGKDEKGEIVSTGNYFYQMKAGEYLQTKKMLLLK